MSNRNGRLPAVARTTVAVALLAMLTLGASPAQALVPPLDPNEPNDSFATATLLANGVDSWGSVMEQADKDYFCIDIPSLRQVSVEFQAGVLGRDVQLVFQPKDSTTTTDLMWDRNYQDDGGFFTSGTLGAGRLFIVVSLVGEEGNPTVYYLTAWVADAGTSSFPDVPVGSDYYTPITYLADEGVVSGYPGGNFRPYDLVTRQQFAKMIVRAVGYPVHTYHICEFVDVETSYFGHYVDPDDPLYPDHYIAVAADHYITVGETATTFGPYHGIKMAQVTTMVVRTARDLGLWDAAPHWYTPPFADFGPPHYRDAREGAAHGLFDGYPGPWDWYEGATRGQCAFFIWKLMLVVQESQGD